MEYATDSIGRVYPKIRVYQSHYERFESVGWVIQNDGCWRWNGRLNDKGYGIFVSPRGQLAHRFSLEHHKGSELTPGLSVLHSCDFRACVNPEHLKEGNHAENMRQAAERLRINSKLKPEQVLDIFEKAGVYSVAELARKYAVSRATIRSIRDQKRWAWLTSEERTHD